MYDLVIKNGTLIDGTGGAATKAEIAIRGERIAAIGQFTEKDTKQTLDITGKVVCPGFVDVHNHSDGWLLKHRNFAPKTRQGFTTEILMADGISYAPVDRFTASEWFHYLLPLDGLMPEDYTGWQSLSDYLELLDKNTAQNVATHIPYANLRSMECGFGSTPPDDFQVEQIQSAVRLGMECGAVGLSTGLEYVSECFATTEELVEACKAMALHNGLYVTHVRYKKGTIEGVREAVEIGKRAGVAVHISHLKGTNPEQTEKLLNYIDREAINEVDFSFDVYPYFSSSTMLSYLLPYEAWIDGPQACAKKLSDPVVRQRFSRYLHSIRDHNLERTFIAWVATEGNKHWIGKSLASYASSTQKELADALADLLIEEQLAALLVIRREQDELAHPFLAHRAFMLGTGGVWFPDGCVHPRMFGSVARLLGPCVRTHKLFSLEDAVSKLTSIPARRFGLSNRGVVQEGAFADLVVFDPLQIKDRATYERPAEASLGVEHVFVNGVQIVNNGNACEFAAGKAPGRALRFHGR